MVELKIHEIESQDELWRKQTFYSYLVIIDSTLKVSKTKTIVDINNAFVAECCMSKQNNANKTREILSHVQNLGLITIDSKTQVVSMTKPFSYYATQLHKKIVNYTKKIEKEKELLRYGYDVEARRKMPLTEEQKKELKIE